MGDNLVISTKNIQIEDVVELALPRYYEKYRNLECLELAIKTIAPNFYKNSKNVYFGEETLRNFVFNIDMAQIDNLVITKETLFDYLTAYKILSMLNFENTSDENKRKRAFNCLEEKIKNYFLKEENIADVYYKLYLDDYNERLKIFKNSKKEDKFFVYEYTNGDHEYPYLKDDQSMVIHGDLGYAYEDFSAFKDELKIKAYSYEELKKYLISIRALGIKNIVFYPSNLSSGFIVRREDIIGSNEIVTDYFNSNLNIALLEYSQFLHFRQSGEKYYNVFEEMKKSLFFVPIAFEDDTEMVEDFSLHATQRAAKKIDEIEKKLITANKFGFSYDNNLGKFTRDYFIVDTEKAKISAENLNSYELFKNYIYGNEKYSLNLNKQDSGQMMHIYSIKGGGKSYLPAFSTIENLQRIIGDKVRIGIYTIDDIVDRLDDKIDNSNESISGIILNPGQNDLIYYKRQFVEKHPQPQSQAQPTTEPTIQSKTQPTTEPTIQPVSSPNKENQKPSKYKKYEGKDYNNYLKFCENSSIHVFAFGFATMCAVLGFFISGLDGSSFLLFLNFAFIAVLQIPSMLRVFKKYRGKATPKLEKSDSRSTMIRIIICAIASLSCFVLAFKNGAMALVGTLIFLCFGGLEVLRLLRLRYFMGKYDHFIMFFEDRKNKQFEKIRNKNMDKKVKKEEQQRQQDMSWFRFRDHFEAININVLTPIIYGYDAQKMTDSYSHYNILELTYLGDKILNFSQYIIPKNEDCQRAKSLFENVLLKELINRLKDDKNLSFDLNADKLEINDNFETLYISSGRRTIIWTLPVVYAKELGDVLKIEGQDELNKTTKRIVEFDFRQESLVNPKIRTWYSI